MRCKVTVSVQMIDDLTSEPLLTHTESNDFSTGNPWFTFSQVSETADLLGDRIAAVAKRYHYAKEYLPHDPD